LSKFVCSKGDAILERCLGALLTRLRNWAHKALELFTERVLQTAEDSGVLQYTAWRPPREVFVERWYCAGHSRWRRTNC
jgi:hypothetical protein